MSTPHQLATDITNRINQKHNTPTTAHDVTTWEHTIKSRPTYPPGIWHHALHTYYNHTNQPPTPQHILTIAQQLATTQPYKHEIYKARQHNQHQRDQQIHHHQQQPTPNPPKKPTSPTIKALQQKARQTINKAKHNQQTNQKQPKTPATSPTDKTKPQT